MFWKASLRNIVREQFVRWSHMPLKLNASFVIKTIEARGEGKTMRTLIFDDTLLDKYDKRQVERASRVQDIISFFSELQSANAVYHMCCTNCASS